MQAEKAVPVIQSNKLIEARYSLTVGEQRLILAMVSMIKPNDSEFTEYTIPLAELARLLGIDLSYTYAEIDKITDRLMSRVLHIRMQNGDLMKLQWVCTAIHQKNSVILSFAPKLKPYLLRLQKAFTITDLNAVKNFQSIYSIRIYQFLKQYAGIGQREFLIDELKSILGIEGQYTAFQDLKRRVLLQAKKEFENQKNNCDLTFQLETIKEGRKITRLKFIIQQRKRNEEKTKPPQTKKFPPVQPASDPAPASAARINRIPFEHDEAFGLWLAKKGMAVDLLQWAESGKNSMICKASFQEFLRERKTGGS